jgi:TetR/AcrR family transcriptional repressor of nem operon
MTRQRIIAEAAPIFNRRGYAGCSIAELMEATGLEKGGIYRHFTGKEELAAEAFRFALAQSVKTRTADLSEIEGSLPKLRFGIRRFVAAPSGVEGGCPLMNTAIDADDGNPVLRELALEGVRAWRERICVIVWEGVARGEILARTEARQVANTIIATLEGALMISRLEDSPNALKDAEIALDGLLRGITAKLQ